jgi:hypothetical protein
MGIRNESADADGKAPGGELGGAWFDHARENNRLELGHFILKQSA